jgi:hypothetical protein
VLPSRDAAPEELKGALARDTAALIRGDWKLFGWREVNVGTPPRWHCDAAAGVAVAPQVLAYQLDHRALPDGADARTVWEINRWSEMVRLSMHGWVNNDIEAVRVSIEWLENWCDENPVGHGINWTSPLEAGLRLVNFVWFDALVECSLCGLQRVSSKNSESLNALKRAQRTLAERIVPIHATWVWRYRSFGSSANNQLLGELVGLLHAVKRWPALEKLTCSAEILWNEISRCVLSQFAEDGGNTEQALHYHLFAWEMAWHAAKLMRVTDGPVIERLNRAASFFVHAAHDSEQWEYGDNDDAQIVPLTLEREHAVAEWRAWMRSEPKAESIRYWLGAPPEGGSVLHSWWLMPGSGMAVREHEGWKVRMDASPLGFGSMAAHGHCDALHVSLWDGSHALIIDPGTGGYYGMKEQRMALADWDAHNAPQPVSGFIRPRRLGLFLWATHHIRPFFREREVDKPDIIAEWRESTASHLGYRTERIVKYDVVSKGWEISDATCIWAAKDMKNGAEPWKTRWYLAPEISVENLGLHAFRLSRSGRRWLMSFRGDDINTCLLQGTASRRYGHFESCPVIEVTGNSPVKTTLLRETH